MSSPRRHARGFGGGAFRAAATRLGVGLVLVATAAVLTYPLLTRPGLPIDADSDILFATQSADGFVKALSEGVPYPRWVALSNRGYGSPTFVFYPPLSGYAVAAAHVLTHDLLAAMRTAAIAATLLAGLTFYLAARPWGRGAALAAAVLYIGLPYRVLDLYERFALAELIAFIWFPLLFLTVRRLVERPRFSVWLGLVAAYTGLLLTHLVSAYLVLFVLVPYAVALAAAARSIRPLALAALAGVAALACGSVYVIPLLAERELVHVEWIRESFYGDYRRNFIHFDEQAAGYRPAIIKPWMNAAADRQAALAAAAGLLFAARRLAASRIPGAARNGPGEGFVQLGLTLWTYVLQTPLSAPLWAVAPGLSWVQFPWRFGAFQALSACFLVACALGSDAVRGINAATVAEPGGRRRRSGPPGWIGWLERLRLPLLACAALPALVLSVRVMASRNYAFDRARAQDPAARTQVMHEYIPKGVADWRRLQKSPVLYEAATLAAPGEVRLKSWKTHARSLAVETKEANRLRLHTFAYPGWTAWIDGKPAPIEPDPATQAIEIAVPTGTHDVELAFAPTWDRLAGAWASLSSACILALVALGRVLLRSRESRRESAVAAGTGHRS